MTPHIENLSRRLGKDSTVISKMLKRMASKADVLAKVSGRRALTDMDRKLNQLSRDYLHTHRATKVGRIPIRIGTNR